MFKDTLLVFFNFSFGSISFSNLLSAFPWKQFRLVTLQKMEFSMKDFFSFFYQGVLSKTLTIHKTAREGRGPSFTPLYHFHPLTNIQRFLQLRMWDDYYVFLIATLVFTRLLLDEIYHLIELPFDWLIDDAIFVCLLDDLILGYCYSVLT